MKKSGKFLLESSVLLTALSIRAKKAGKGLKEYLYEAETIKHISLVLYDLLPLSVKIGMRYEKFHEIFERNFKAIRDALLGKELVSSDSIPVISTELNKEKQQTVENKPVKRVRKAPVKTVTKKTVSKKLKEQK